MLETKSFWNEDFINFVISYHLLRHYHHHLALQTSKAHHNNALELTRHAQSLGEVFIDRGLMESIFSTHLQRQEGRNRLV